MFRSELTEADLEEELGPPGKPTCRGSVKSGVLSLICTFFFLCSDWCLEYFHFKSHCSNKQQCYGN